VIQPPVFAPMPGIEDEWSAMPPLFEPPMFDPESAIDLPPIEGPPMPADFEIEAGPAVVEPPQPTEIEAAPMRAPLEGIAAPVEGPDVDVARGFDALREVGSVRTQAQQQGATAAQTYRAAAQAYQGATTPAARAAAEKQAAEALQQIEGADAVAGAAALAEEREHAAQQATVEDAIGRVRTAKMAEVAQVLDERAADAELAMAKARATQAAAQERRAAREAEYAALLDRGPQDQSATWTSAIGMIGELWSAYAQKREPNLGVWLERGLQQARESHQGDLAAVEKRIGIEEGMEEDAAVLIAQRQADDLAFEQAYLTKIQRDLEVVAAQYGHAPQGMAAEQARQRVAAQQQVRAGEAAAASEKAQREREKHATEMRKLGAEASIAERKAAGGGGIKPSSEFGTATNISPDALVDPMSGRVIGASRFTGRGDVARDQKTLEEMTTATVDIESYLNQLDKVKQTYRGFGKGAVRSDDVAKLEAMYADLYMKTTRALTGAAVSKQQEELIKKIIPEVKSYMDVGKWDPARVMRDYRDRMAGETERFLASRLVEGGTRIFGQKGEVLPSSPTYGFRANQGQKPAATKTSRIVEDLTPRDEETSGIVDTLLGKPRRAEAPSKYDVEAAREQLGDETPETEAKAHAQVRIDMRDPWRARVVQHWTSAAGTDGKERDEIIEALEGTRDALEATGSKERAKYLDRAIKFAREGKTPADYYRSLIPNAHAE
jgi:hypothetical protein